MKNNPLNILALIPARSGSQRLPKKNILPFCGKPLIAWTIEAAKNIPEISTIMVSTDSEEIASISKKFGALVPSLRPPEIAQNNTTMIEVIQHTLKFYRENNQNFTHLLLLQPTSPLRTSEDIKNSINLLKEKNATAVYGVCPAEHSPLWMNTLPDDKNFEKFLNPNLAGMQSQSLPTYYRLNGAIYLVEIAAILKHNSLHINKNCFALVMSPHHSADIDSELDFILAEATYKHFDKK